MFLPFDTRQKTQTSAMTQDLCAVRKSGTACCRFFDLAVFDLDLHINTLACFKQVSCELLVVEWIFAKSMGRSSRCQLKMARTKRNSQRIFSGTTRDHSKNVARERRQIPVFFGVNEFIFQQMMHVCSPCKHSESEEVQS